ncbi:DUF998 domain-containing protein [Plantactinospora endophytica]|uniref:DUF998 domain-containing protein n=1 Tax=Plantactinospora endophytica TaxID=673535 RepID=A0ABQ4E8M5_9ACTN|nr:DUF998 domain-containing protein [Plantactinospora endophytica]GIG91075.1 hypothetical protein Pen02_60110 [Plantactinospora endophytica]
MDLPRTARIGALCWIVATPLFLAANVVVGLRWSGPAFSWAEHNISDLGNVTCGIWNSSRPRYVCSPWHDAMNATVLLTALLLAAGTLLTWRVAGSGRRVRAVQSLLLLAAIGYALAGVFPADVDENLHVLGALLIMGFGNLGLLLAALAPGSTPLGRLRARTLALALTALAGTTLFFAQQGLGLGVGGMERVAVFPLLLWTCAVGITLLRPAHHASRSTAETDARQ